jgi:hypothetical protein
VRSVTIAIPEKGGREGGRRLGGIEEEATTVDGRRTRRSRREEVRPLA